MKDKKEKISNILCAVVILILLACSIFFFSQRSQNKVTFVFNKSIVMIVSPSMEEVIEEKSYILIEKIDASEIKTGDIIMFYSDDPAIKGKLNTHRVVGIVGDNEEFVTKGDNNPVEDKYTAKAENVVGIYRKNMPGLTAVLRFFLSKGGLAVIIVLFVGLTTFLVAPEFIKYSRERAAEKENQTDEQKQAEIDRLVQEELQKLRNQNKDNHSNGGDDNV